MPDSHQVTAQHFMPLTYKGVAQYGVLYITKESAEPSSMLFNLGSEGGARRAAFVIFFATAQGYKCEMTACSLETAKLLLPPDYNLPRRKPIVLAYGAALADYAAHLKLGLYIPVSLTHTDDTNQ